VGFVLMAHTVRDALDSGVHEYRLLLGDEAYKGRFANGSYHADTLGRGASLRGRAAIAAYRAGRTLPTPLRRPLGRLARG
jgi:CelD/BcsL family acetyltransferase involved in cellulose biosynthesis